MDEFSLIVEIIGWILDAFITSADIYSWFKGKPNRGERKAARRSGAPVPPRDQWNRWVVYLTVAACVLTIILLAWKGTRSLARH